MKSSYFLENDRFLDYLQKTHMYRETYASKEGIASVLLAIVSACYLVFAEHLVSGEVLSAALQTLLGIIIGGGFGLLGFLVGGLGILIGSISDKVISIVDKANKFESLLGIIFRFYYDGAALVILIGLGILDYMLLILPTSFNMIFLIVLALLTAYAFWYSLMLSVMLLGTSIRLLLLRHAINNQLK